jgi:hypothetical protein
VACLVVLGAMSVGQTLVSPTSPPRQSPTGAAGEDASPIQQPLAKADRLQIANQQQKAVSEAALRSIIPVAARTPRILCLKRQLLIDIGTTHTTRAPQLPEDPGEPLQQRTANRQLIQKVAIVSSQTCKPNLAIGQGLRIF